MYCIDCQCFYIELIESKKYEEAYNRCEQMSNYILNEAQKKLNRTINPYNIKLDCPVPGCFDMTNVSLCIYYIELINGCMYVVDQLLGSL